MTAATTLTSAASTTTYNVQRLTLDQQMSDLATRWDAYVTEHSEGTFFHLSTWQTVIKRAFGHEMFLLYIEHEGAIRGVLNLGYIRSKLFGKSLISAPFCVYGGTLADNDEIRDSLESYARDLAEKLGVGYVEYRNRQPVDQNRPRKDLYVTFRKAISEDHDANLSAIPRKQRAVVRKGIKANLISSIDTDSKRLYEAYSESVRNLGTPVFSQRYFDVLLEEFSEAVDIVTVTNADGVLLGSVMNFYFRDEVLPYYGGGTEAARGQYANDFMYWEVMRRAVDRGCRVFDYGRSKQGTGSYRFKKHWGFEPEPLHYEYDLVKSKEMPDISPVNPKFELMVKTWKKLPLPVSRIVGPWVARDLA